MTHFHRIGEKGLGTVKETWVFRLNAILVVVREFIFNYWR